MFPRALRIGQVGGVDVRVDPSWIIIALLFLWSFFTRFADPGSRPLAIALSMAGTATLIFFLSVLAHEVAHALEARHRDLDVNAITLFLFGGVTEIQGEPRRPRDEFALAAVGPFVSIVAAALLGIATVGADAIAAPRIAEVTGTMAWINLLLGFFNLLPGAPLDGGRVLRALIWAVTRDRHRAIRFAAYAGQGLAGLLWLLGLWMVLVSPGSGFFSALWFGAIGWVMWQAAVGERRFGATQALVAGKTVADIVAGSAPRFPADRPLTLVVDQIASTPGIEIYPVVAGSDREGSGEVVGALHLPDVLAMDPTDRNFRNAGEVMRPIAAIPEIDADAPVHLLLQRLHQQPLLKVCRDGTVIALITARQANAALERLHALREERHRAPRRPEAGP